ncbi:hypothetical protein [Kerstersia gyiorum]|uniref:hypothetical protein n=1 Tax=Kerstersia gyiorum TaxID=206506 RepID=UPI00209F4AC4|nr:hypothetical protein [Kerstersia gyiorum]MCP1679959.1 hypothetical protein [Kerstersia gyiorum]MCP1708109.1 hypothetical protein [Kerstersia gyiorum]
MPAASSCQQEADLWQERQQLCLDRRPIGRGKKIMRGIDGAAPDLHDTRQILSSRQAKLKFIHYVLFRIDQGPLVPAHAWTVACDNSH